MCTCMVNECKTSEVECSCTQHTVTCNFRVYTHPIEQSYVRNTPEMHCMELHMLKLFNIWQMHTHATFFNMHFIHKHTPIHFIESSYSDCCLTSSYVWILLILSVYHMCRGYQTKHVAFTVSSYKCRY